MTDNLILNTDSYKLSHFKQYPEGTTCVSSYIEARNGGRFDHLLYFGLQAFLKGYLAIPITRDDIDEAEAVSMAHVGVFNRADWMHILNRHGGYLPLRVESLPEGTITPAGTPLVQVANTDPSLPWLPTYVEPGFLRAVWYPSTVATVSLNAKRILMRYLEQTADAPEDVLPFQLHDFGARGATAHEAAGLGGMGHLLNFKGTDTIAALMAARRFYGAEMAGFSIPASEHSTMTTWGRSGERDAYENMIRTFAGPDKLMAFVVDSYDVYNAVDNIIGRDLGDLIRNQGGRVVVRPDSGIPHVIVPEIIERLMARFGFTYNQRGYKVLPPYIRIIQGDGVTVDSLPRILEAMKEKGLSTENAAFGMGGGLLQKVERDTLRFAMKASYAEVDGECRNVFKDPVTDPGKRSKAGRLAVVKSGRWAKAIPEQTARDGENLLRPVFENGELLIDESWDDIVARASIEFTDWRAETENQAA